MNGLISTTNDGEFLVATNYWETDLAQQGLLYLSINAGAFRLLVPDSSASSIADMLTAKHVIITHRFVPSVQRFLYELLFDDGTSEPFVAFICPDQIERPFSITEARSQSRRLHLYGEGCQLKRTFDVFF